jgi:hypothetical protein
VHKHGLRLLTSACWAVWRQEYNEKGQLVPDAMVNDLVRVRRCDFAVLCALLMYAL